MPGHVVWGDYDKGFPPCRRKYGEPPITIAFQTSRKGCHVYWILNRDVSPKEYEDLNHRIAIGHKDSGCDQGGWDLTQLLRIPGTINNKRKKPFKVGGGIVNRYKYAPDEFKGLPPLAVTSTSHRGVELDFHPEPPIPVQDLRVPAETKDDILYPGEVGERSEPAWGAMQRMIDGGHSASEIFAVFRANPIGERYPTDSSLRADIQRAFEKREGEILPRGGWEKHGELLMIIDREEGEQQDEQEDKTQDN